MKTTQDQQTAYIFSKVIISQVEYKVLVTQLNEKDRMSNVLSILEYIFL